MRVNLNLPLNSVSFGQLSTIIIREAFNKKQELCLFPIGNGIDLGSQSDLSQDFGAYINNSISNALTNFDRKDPIFKLWHLNGSLESYARDQILLSFYELDNPTPIELNVVRNNKKVLFSSQETVSIFNTFGCKNVSYLPLAFDKYNFKNTDRKYFQDDRIIFNLAGKLEKRKHHLKIIRSWIKKFGNNKKYNLQCAIFNPFIKPEDQSSILNSALEGKSYFNVNFLGYMPQNKIYNDYLNSADIIIGMSGGEGWGLPEFHSVALGKHAVILNAHGYKSWANDSNSIMVNPSSKIDAFDGVFFQKGQPYNQGNIYDFNEDDFISACEKAISRVESSRVNKNGLDLQKLFTTENLYNNIIEALN